MSLVTNRRFSLKVWTISEGLFLTKNEPNLYEMNDRTQEFPFQLTLPLVI